MPAAVCPSLQRMRSFTRSCCTAQLAASKLITQQLFELGDPLVEFRRADKLNTNFLTLKKPFLCFCCKLEFLTALPGAQFAEEFVVMLQQRQRNQIIIQKI